ncbi:MAG: hypothetical protein WA051_00610 [Minisyncoccia bacterium]
MPRKDRLAPVLNREEAHIDAVMRELHESDTPLTHAEIGRLLKKPNGEPRTRQRVAVRIRRAGGRMGSIKMHHEDSLALGVIHDPEVTSVNHAAAKIHRSTKYVEAAWKRNGKTKEARKLLSRHRRQMKMENLRQLADQFRLFAIELGQIPSATWLMRCKSRYYWKVQHFGGFKMLRKHFPDLSRKPWSPTPSKWFPPEESASA